MTLYLQTGGVEKSLLALLSSLDYDKYEVDLLLFDHSGVLFDMVPPEVNVLPPLFETYSTPLASAASELVKKGQFRLLTGKVLAASLARFSSGVGTGVRWAVYRHTLAPVRKHYDIAISYLDIFCNYYVAEMVSAKKKIMYNHMDYAESLKKGWPCPKLENKSFESCDYIVTVAESAYQSLKAFFPQFQEKMRIIHNSVSVDTVRALANEGCEEFSMMDGIKIVTVARLVEEKGVLLALSACKLLVDQGYKVRWYMIGNGSMRQILEENVKKLGIEQQFILLGEKANPYPYMAGCDIYVQPSKTEAHCVAVEEALALTRPIIVTDIPSFRNQIKDEETGLVVETSAEGIAKGIKQLIESLELREKLINTLAKLTNRNQEELAKFCQLIEN